MKKERRSPVLSQHAFKRRSNEIWREMKSVMSNVLNAEEEEDAVEEDDVPSSMLE